MRHFKHKRDFQVPSIEETAALQALVDILSTVSAPTIVDMIRAWREQMEKQQMALDTQLASDDAARTKILVQEQEGVLRDAKMKYMADQYADMARMNQEIDRMTQAFRFKQHAANIRFIQRCYGHRAK